MRAASSLALACVLALPLGCGPHPDRARTTPSAHATHGPSAVPQAQPSAGGSVVVVQAAPSTPRGHVVVVQEQAPAPQPQVVVVPQPQAYEPAAHEAWGDGPIRCGGDEHIRLTDMELDGGHAPAIVATGNCRVEVSEAIVRGEPAVVVSGNARVTLIESKVFGDLVSRGGARIVTRGTRHHGQVRHGA